jgi:hypothetical protein
MLPRPKPTPLSDSIEVRRMMIEQIRVSALGTEVYVNGILRAVIKPIQWTSKQS